MVVDSGADHCLFNNELAHERGLNPLEGGHVVGTSGVGGTAQTAVWPIEVVVDLVDLVDLHTRFTIWAQFAQLPPGANGLLGNHGFFDHFERLRFFPQERVFEIAS